MTLIVAIEIGNTTVSFGLATATTEWPPVWSARVDQMTAQFDAGQLATDLPDHAARWCVSSVHRACERQLAGWVCTSRSQDRYHCLRSDDLPLTIGVAAPEKVGMDRLVAAVAVNRLRDANRPAIVIDAGTAITIDAVDRQGCFCGGVILSGMQVTARGLAASTDLLPEVGTRFEEGPPEIIGRSTVEAIRSGLFHGTVGAVRECVTKMSRVQVGTPQVFVTGGGSLALKDSLDFEHQFVPDLVLAGIVACPVAS
jgi:type III pantothenate kinase